MLCVHNFAPEKEITVKKQSSYSINNKLKEEISEKIQVFQNWLKTAIEKNRNKYKKRTWWKFWLKNVKRRNKFDKLRKNPNAKTIYRNLKSHRGKDQPTKTIPDLGIIKLIFTSIGPKLASAIPPAQHMYGFDNFEKSWFWTIRMKWKCLNY